MGSVQSIAGSFVSAEVLKEQLGLPNLSDQTLWRYRQEGMPHVPMAKDCFYDVTKVRTWMAVHGKTGIQGRPSAAFSEADADLRRQLTETRIAKEKVMTAKHQHLLDLAQGQVVRRATVEEGNLSRVAAVKGALLALPGKLSQRLAMRDANAVQVELEAEVHAILASFSRAGEAILPAATVKSEATSLTQAAQADGKATANQVSPSNQVTPGGSS